MAVTATASGGIMDLIGVVNRAALSCGLVSSFNAGEVPEDIQARGADLLTNEIIPGINNDRTLDVAEYAIKLKPTGNTLILRPVWNKFPHVILGVTYYTSKDLLNVVKLADHQFYMPLMREYLVNKGLIKNETYPMSYVITDKYPVDTLGKPRKVYVWSSDFKLIDVSGITANEDEDTTDRIDKRFNVPYFVPRVTSVINSSNKSIMKQVNVDEIAARSEPNTYCVTAIGNDVCIGFAEGMAPEQVTVCLPIPIRVVNNYLDPSPYKGEVLAPEKFNTYLIASLAFRLAIEYGLDTAQTMKVLVDQSYGGLIKNLPKVLHGVDVPERIGQYLGRRFPNTIWQG